MKIQDLKELEKLIRLCRKAGITVIKVDGIELALTEQPPRKAVKRSNSFMAPSLPGIDENTPVETIDMPDSLTEEQLLYYSATENQQ